MHAKLIKLHVDVHLRMLRCACRGRCKLNDRRTIVQHAEKETHRDEISVFVKS